MRPVRTLARLMLSSVFVVSGVRTVRNSRSLSPQAEPLAQRAAPLLRRVHPQFPSEAEQLVRFNGAMHVVAGWMLATGRLTRPAAAMLAASMIPTTLAGHSFWKEDDPGARMNHQIHFLKNLGLIGGLLLAAADTQGRPGLRWRANHRLHHSRRGLRRAVRTARRDTRLARRSASAARRLPAAKLIRH